MQIFIRGIYVLITIVKPNELIACRVFTEKGCAVRNRKYSLNTLTFAKLPNARNKQNFHFNERVFGDINQIG